MLHLWLVAASLLGANGYLEEGRRAYERFDLPTAEKRLRMALESAELEPDERRQTVELLAMTLAAQGRMADVEQVFSAWLVQRPDAVPPENAPPKVRAAFQRAKSQLYAPRYFRMELAPSPEERLVVAVIDPWRLLQGVVWTDGAGARLPLTSNGDRPSLEPRPRGAGTLIAEDEAQAELGRLEVPALPERVEPLAVGAPIEAVAPTPPRWPKWTLTVLSAVLVGVGTFLAISSRADDAAAHGAFYASDARALTQSAWTKATASRIVFGTSALSIGGATWLWLDP